MSVMRMIFVMSVQNLSHYRQLCGFHGGDHTFRLFHPSASPVQISAPTFRRYRGASNPTVSLPTRALNPTPSSWAAALACGYCAAAHDPSDQKSANRASVTYICIIIPIYEFLYITVKQPRTYFIFGHLPCPDFCKVKTLAYVENYVENVDNSDFVPI